MYNLIAIGDPIIDTHVQIDDECKECRVHEEHQKFLSLDYGAKIPIVDSFQALGGNAPNVAVGAVKLGLTSALVSTIGKDVNGEMAMAELKKQGVDTSMITYDTNSKTRYSIVLNYRQERTILSYSDKKTYVWPEKMPDTEWIYYTGLSEGFEMLHDHLLAYLEKHPSTRLAINPGSYTLKYALDRLQEVVKQADVLIVNLEEAEKIVGTTLEKAKSEAALIRKLIELGADEVALTDGSRGAWAGTKDNLWHIDSFPVKVVAKTGAGDAFSAGYLTARQYGHDIPTALRWGTANSSSVVGQHGSQTGLADKKGIEKMLHRFSSVQPTGV